jgi:hypothetical protein
MEAAMHNWHAIETEAAFRRQEWERAVAAYAREEQARSPRRRFGWPSLPSFPMATLRARLALRRPMTAPPAPCAPAC